MKQMLEGLSRGKKAMIIALGLLAVGACVTWEVREVDNARTGQPITRSRGIVLPWQTCGASGRGTLVNFHVRQWMWYGLVKMEATGQTM
jgi:hypothetical protein